MTAGVPDFQSYRVPHYRRLQRIELRLTWEQNQYLDDLEAVIGRDMPEGDRSDPAYRRITKNSVIRSLIEIARQLEVGVEAHAFRNERDLLLALLEALRARLADPATAGRRQPRALSPHHRRARRRA